MVNSFIEVTLLIRGVGYLPCQPLIFKVKYICKLIKLFVIL